MDGTILNKIYYIREYGVHSCRTFSILQFMIIQLYYLAVSRNKILFTVRSTKNKGQAGTFLQKDHTHINKCL